VEGKESNLIVVPSPIKSVYLINQNYSHGQQTARFATVLRSMGVQRGDRVCAVLPNTPQTVAVFLAVASLGAVWSICSPDMGPVAVLDRFRQIEPVVLVACDEVRWAGVLHDKRALVDELLRGLPSVRHAVRGARIDALLDGEAGADAATAAAQAPAHAPEALPFDHPLWIVYSSGTTGLPKPIVHGHGGVMVEALKSSLLNNLGPTAETGDRFHWFSTTGWIMWNCQMAGLLGGTTICLFDGSPGGPSAAPDWTTLWRFAALSRATGKDAFEEVWTWKIDGTRVEFGGTRATPAAGGRPAKREALPKEAYCWGGTEFAKCD
jgi:acetoacetyl-CoA synthetase